VVTATPLPAPTPTPRSHKVAAGEDMSGLALRYGVSVAGLEAANPRVDPHAMSIGTILIVPPENGQGQAAPAQELNAALPLTAVHCAADRLGGLWCFTAAKNNDAGSVDNLQVEFRLVEDATGETRALRSAALLDLLLPGESMPFAAYFPASVPGAYHAGAELISALPVPAGDNRYLKTRLENLKTEINADGLSALITVTAGLEAGQKNAATLLLAAAAYDAEGNLVGARRSVTSSPLEAGARRDLSLSVFSMGETITRVDVLVELKP